MEPRTLRLSVGGEQRCGARQLDRDGGQARGERGRGEPAFHALGPAQHAREVAEEGKEEEHADEFDTPARVAAEEAAAE